MNDAVFARRSILCVEPDEATQALLSTNLPGQRLTFASNAYEALRNINSQMFDLHLLEFWLPDWTGVQLCRQIRQQDPRVPIVFYTAATREADEQRAMRAGATAFYNKPIELSVLRVCVDALLERSTVESLNARVHEEQAIQDELQSRAAALAERTQVARKAAASAIERTTRIKASKAFIESGGTHANFERWWPHAFSSARAGFSAMPE